MYDYKTKLSAVGVVKQVLGSNTYYVDCGQGLRHISGDALSKSLLDIEDCTADPKLTAQNGSQLAQEDDALIQEDSDVVVESDSSDDEDYIGQDVAPLAVQRRRRRVRNQELGPIIAARLRPRH